jgi:hypothetical protein
MKVIEAMQFVTTVCCGLLPDLRLFFLMLVSIVVGHHAKDFIVIRHVEATALL